MILYNKHTPLWNIKLPIEGRHAYLINELTLEEKKVPAILCSASGSQELGSEIGAVLSGKVSPAGRLPMTWYRSEADLPEGFIPESETMNFGYACMERLSV